MKNLKEIQRKSGHTGVVSSYANESENSQRILCCQNIEARSQMKNKCCDGRGHMQKIVQVILINLLLLSRDCISKIMHARTERQREGERRGGGRREGEREKTDIIRRLNYFIHGLC